MTVSPEIEAEIRRLHYAEHWKIGTIAKQLGHHPDVIRRVIGREPGHVIARAAPRPSLVTPYAAFIDEQLTRYPKLRATRLYDMIRERGFQGSARIVRLHVARVRPAPKSEVYLRTEPMVGEQAQIDWAHVGKIRVPGGERALWAFVMVLSYSRAMWAELVIDLTVHSVRRSLIRAAQHFGGSTRQWLFDNPRTIVLDRRGDAVRFHPVMLDLSGLFRTELRLCRVRRPTDKGKVERAIRYLRDRFFAARTIRSIDEGNRSLEQFLAEIANVRPHPVRADRSVRDLLLEERSHLLSLPIAPVSIESTRPTLVDKTASVRFDGNSYSVPARYATSTLILSADDRVVRVLDASTEVASHLRNWGRGQRIEDPMHRQEIVALKRGARDLKGRDRLRALCPEIETLFARWVHDGRHTARLVTRVLQSLDLYGEQVFVAAVAEMIRREMHDPGALAVLCERHRRAHHREVSIPLRLGPDVPDRDVIPHDLEGYDGK